jgi:putative endonuclease
LSGRREEGIQGEEQATKTLKDRGYRIIEKNYRSPFGELDIIAEEGGYIVFVEVKKRNTRSFGGSFEAVNALKKKRIIKTALFYMKTHKCLDRKVRFDVVGIDRENVKIVKHAFILEQ